jgi:hypothetical protein
MSLAGMMTEPRTVRALPIEFWLGRPRRRRQWLRPFLQLAGLAALGALIGWLFR